MYYAKEKMPSYNITLEMCSLLRLRQTKTYLQSDIVHIKVQKISLILFPISARPWNLSSPPVSGHARGASILYEWCGRVLVQISTKFLLLLTGELLTAIIVLI